MVMCIERTVEEQRVVCLRTGNEPVHRVQDVDASGDRAWVLRVVCEHKNVFVPEPVIYYVRVCGVSKAVDISKEVRH